MGKPTEGTPPPETITPEPKSALADPLMASLAEDLGVIIQAEEGKTEIKPVDEAKPDGEGEKKADEAKVEDPPKPIKATVRKTEDRIREVVDNRINERLKETKQDPPPTLPDKGAKKDDDTEGLSPEQLDELADAAHAETVDAEKYKGFRGRMREFYRKVDKWVEDHKDDADRTFDQSDPEFVAYVKANKPDWGGKRETIRIDRITEEKVAKRMREREGKDSERISKVEREAREANVRPSIERELTSFGEELASALKTEDPLEAEIYETFNQSAVQLAGDYMRLITGLDTMGDHNPAALKARHSWLVGFVTSKGEEFAKTAKPEEKIRSGKNYVTPKRYSEMQAANDPNISKAWTLTKDDVLRMLRQHAATEAGKAVQQEVARAEKRGFTRQKPKQVSTPKGEIKPEGGPKLQPKPSPGATGGRSSEGERHLGHEIVADLELDT